MSEMSVKEAYRVMQAKCGIEVGDTVKIVRGYDGRWAKAVGFSGTGLCCEFNRIVGETRQVASVGTWHIGLDWNGRGSEIFAPFFCLELVEKAKPKLPPIMVGGNEVKFFREGISHIEVCGVTVHKETIRKILDRMEHWNC